LTHRSCNSAWGKAWDMDNLEPWQEAALFKIKNSPRPKQSAESNAKRSVALKAHVKSKEHCEALRVAGLAVERVACPRGCGLVTLNGGPMARHLGRKVQCAPL
jgi:hypothetical protein